MQLIHHGGKNTVTGSCHELTFGDRSILIDCGLFQGSEALELSVSFPLENIKALVLTHAHIDHIGRIPWLLAEGFDKPIYCTKATAELVPLMLDDGLKIQQGLSYEARKQVLDAICRLIQPVDYYRWIDVDTFRCRFNPAGHILGSVYVEVELPNQELVVFSGDLGPTNTPLLPDPVSPEKADYLVIETTYGDTQHDGIESRGQKLKEIIERSLSDGGTILIPAFSVGRTQELLFDIEQLIFEHQIDVKLPIILDSPMALKVTESYRKFRSLWGEEAKHRLKMHRHPLAFEQCIVVEDYKSHQALVNRLASTGEPAIVVAASGMCEGGRIMDYLKALLPDERTDVIFAGYQAEGTLGKCIQQGNETVWIDEDEVSVNAHIHTMSGYSAHADKDDLMDFVEGIPVKPREIHLVHGEPEAKQAFASQLKGKGFNVVD